MQSKDVFLIQSCRMEGKINFLPFLRFIVLMFFFVMFKYVREWEEFIGTASLDSRRVSFFNLINFKDSISINRRGETQPRLENEFPRFYANICFQTDRDSIAQENFPPTIGTFLIVDGNESVFNHR